MPVIEKSRAELLNMLGKQFMKQSNVNKGLIISGEKVFNPATGRFVKKSKKIMALMADTRTSDNALLSTVFEEFLRKYKDTNKMGPMMAEDDMMEAGAPAVPAPMPAQGRQLTQTMKRLT